MTSRNLKLSFLVICLIFVASAAIVGILVFQKVGVQGLKDDPTAAERLQMQVHSAQRASGTPRILKLDQAELNLLIRSILERNRDSTSGDSEGRVRNIVFKLSDHLLHAYVFFTFHGRELSFDVDGTLRTQNGYVEFDPVSGRVGAMPVPRSTLEAVLRQMMSSPKSREMMRLPPDLSDLRVENSKLVVIYR